MTKVFLFLADGFEEIEAVATVDILRRAGMEVQVVSILKGLVAKGANGVQVVADSAFETTRFDGADLLILPGGMPGAENLSAHAGLNELILREAEKGTTLAAICAAPLVYGRLGLLQGKKATCYPGFEHELKGAEFQKVPVVIDGKMITGRGPGVVFDFAYALVEYFCGAEKVQELKAGMIYNS